MKAIEVKDLTFRYGSRTVLSGVSFDVSEGEFIGVIGLNGSGKSTLIKLLLGQLLPRSGQVSVYGKPAHEHKEQAQIGYVPQNIAKYADFPATVYEVVEANLFSQIGLMRFAEKRHRQKVADVLSMVGLDGKFKSLVGNLSGGEQQRMMIARTLIGEPHLLLLDEPTSGIDAESSVKLCDLLYALCKKQGITIIMVTHDIASALAYCDRFLCIEDGTLVGLSNAALAQELAHKHKH